MDKSAARRAAFCYALYMSEKKQLLHISGGEAFDTYEKFLDFLRTRTIQIENEFPAAWTTQEKLQEALGEEWHVIRPQMPNKQNAQYNEWKIWFEKYLEHMKDSFVLTGLSLGAMFLARYLSENLITPKPAKVLLLAGAAVKEDMGGEDGGDFFAELDQLQKITEQGFEVHLLHSQDDPLVPFKHLQVFSENMPNAQTHIFNDKAHFWYPECSEVIEIIKK